MPMSVGVCGQIRAVYRHVFAYVGEPLPQASQHPINARRQRPAVPLSELTREAIASPERWSAAQYCLQLRVLGDESHGTSPRRQRINALDKDRSHHRAKRIALASRPADIFKGSDERLDLRRVKYLCELSNRRLRWYVWRGHGTPLLPVVQAPGSSNFAGVNLYVYKEYVTRTIGRKNCGIAGEKPQLLRGSGLAAILQTPSPGLEPGTSQLAASWAALAGGRGRVKILDDVRVARDAGAFLVL